MLHLNRGRKVFEAEPRELYENIAEKNTILCNLEISCNNAFSNILQQKASYEQKFHFSKTGYTWPSDVRDDYNLKPTVEYDKSNKNVIKI